MDSYLDKYCKSKFNEIIKKFVDEIDVSDDNNLANIDFLILELEKVKTIFAITEGDIVIILNKLTSPYKKIIKRDNSYLWCKKLCDLYKSLRKKLCVIILQSAIESKKDNLDEICSSISYYWNHSIEKLADPKKAKFNKNKNQDKK